MNRPVFANDGHMIFPVAQCQHGATEDSKVRYVVDQAYCPQGCSILDQEHPIHGSPGLHIGFSRPGMKGELVLSAIQGDFEKIMLSGELVDKGKNDLYCPHCGMPFAKLVNCSCSPGANVVVIGLTVKLDFNNAIAFCNVAGCRNGVFVRSGQVLSAVWNDGRY
jgi:hypothetical protein